MVVSMKRGELFSLVGNIQRFDLLSHTDLSQLVIWAWSDLAHNLYIKIHTFSYRPVNMNNKELACSIAFIKKC
jgi:hypothetical protein